MLVDLPPIQQSRALDAALAAGRPVDVPVDSVAADLLGARSVGALNLWVHRPARRRPRGAGR